MKMSVDPESYEITYQGTTKKVPAKLNRVGAAIVGFWKKHLGSRCRRSVFPEMVQFVAVMADGNRVDLKGVIVLFGDDEWPGIRLEPFDY